MLKKVDKKEILKDQSAYLIPSSFASARFTLHYFGKTKLLAPASPSFYTYLSIVPSTYILNVNILSINKRLPNPRLNF